MLTLLLLEPTISSPKGVPLFDHRVTYSQASTPELPVPQVKQLPTEATILVRYVPLSRSNRYVDFVVVAEEQLERLFQNFPGRPGTV